MNPVYFPFTVLSAANIMNLAACFSSLTICRVSDGPLPEEMEMGTNRDFLSIRIPVSGEEGKLESVLKDYKNWADLHMEDPAAFFKSQTETLPFYSDSSISRIRMDIQRKQSGMEKTALEMPERRFAARLFLRIAEEHDLADITVYKDLDAFEKMQQALFNDLKGDPGDRFALKNLSSKPVFEDPGSRMTVERIRAWSILAFSGKEASGVYVTDSPAVINCLKEQNDALKPVCVFNGIPVRLEKYDSEDGFKHQLAGYLKRLAKDSDFPSADDAPMVPERRCHEKAVTLTVYRVSGKSPLEYFGCFFSDTSDMMEKHADCICQNTVICSVESTFL